MCTMKLADFLKHRDISPEAFALLMGDVSVSGVRKWIADERIPRKDQIERIAAITGGLVMPNDFFSLPSPSSHDVDRVATAGPDGGPSESGPAFSREAAE